MISNRCARKYLVTNCNSIISKNYLRFLVDSNDFSTFVSIMPSNFKIRNSCYDYISIRHIPTIRITHKQQRLILLFTVCGSLFHLRITGAQFRYVVYHFINSAGLLRTQRTEKKRHASPNRP